MTMKVICGRALQACMVDEFGNAASFPDALG
jgi:hypothetical protein